MPRIPYPEAASSVPDIQANGTRTINIQRMLLHLSPRILETFGNFGMSLLWEGSLDPILRELALVRVGLLSKSAYEVYHHDALALQVGVSQAKLDALREDEIGDAFTAEEQAVLKFTDEIVKNVRPSDEALGELQKYMSSSEIMELVLVSGNYMVVSRLLETFGVELDDFGLELPA